MSLKDWQTILFMGATGGLVVWSVVAQPGIETQALVLAPAVLLLGVPHGAFDLPIAQRVWPLVGARGIAKFAAIYLGLAALVVAVWVSIPVAALGAFLVYSILHFSSDWMVKPLIVRCAGAALTVGAPCLFHPQEVTEIFCVLTSGATVQPLVTLGSVLGIAGITLAGIAVLLQRDIAVTLELATLVLAGALLQPLVFFIAYFCFLHSPRHLTDTLRALKFEPAAMGGAVAILATTALMAVAAFALIDVAALEDRLLRLVFIGLAALTVPHMLLVENWTRLRRGLVKQRQGLGSGLR